MKNLKKESLAYYENNNYYEIFSKSEDYEGKISEYLSSLKSNVCLDAGCGTGKYTNVLENISNKYIGIDLSKNQIEIANVKKTKSNTTFIVSNLKDIPLKDSSIDLIISSWVLGTITNINERKSCLDKLKKLLRQGGKIILIENDDHGEFESIRNKGMETINYNNWLIKEGFIIDKKINTRFIFNNKEEAKECIYNIYGNRVADKINSKYIKHNVVIFKYEK